MAKIYYYSFYFIGLGIVNLIAFLYVSGLMISLIKWYHK